MRTQSAPQCTALAGRTLDRSLHHDTALALCTLVLACLTLSCGNDKVASRPAAADVQAEQPDSTLLGDGLADDDIDAEDTPELDVPSDVTSADSVDAGSAVCPGGPKCPCEKHENCDSGICLDFLEGKQCAVPCVSDGGCPSGTTCAAFGTSDSTFACVSNYVTLCSPCLADLDCTNAGVKSLCLDYGSEGKFCGGACALDGDCPDGYACAGIADPASGKTVQQCKRKPDATGALACPCSPWAASSGHSTACTVDNAAGSCAGKRSCSATGLSPCNAKTPTVEVCNAADDDCDGKIDDLPAAATCTVKAFGDGGTGGACTGDGDCAAVPGQACDGGTCKALIGACPGTPSCTTSGLLVCVNAKTPKLEICDGDDNDCDGATDEGFTWISPDAGSNGPDGKGIAVGKACGAGVCAGGSVQCATLGSAACTTAVKAKPEQCNGFDDDCNGQSDELACDDKDACSTDLCDAGTGVCSHKPAVDCDDGNQCTTDACNAATGACGHVAYVGSCSDDDSCTIGDACQVAADGTPTCAAGAAANCDDANVCTDDSCAVKTGCVHLANDVTLACYNGAPGTEGVGPCKSGMKTCLDSKLGFCLGEYAPNPVEQCDGTDDNCNGVTDEGCKSGTVQAGFATASGGSGGGWLEFATGAPSGESAVAGGKTGWWGLVQWFVAVLQ